MSVDVNIYSMIGSWGRNRLILRLLTVIMIVVSTPFADAHTDDGEEHVASGVYASSAHEEMPGELALPSATDASDAGHVHIHTCCPHPPGATVAHLTESSAADIFGTMRRRTDLPSGHFELPFRPPTPKH